MKFAITTVAGMMTFSEADFRALQAEDCFARPDGQSLSSLLEDMPEVYDVGYYMLAKTPHISLTLNANDLGGAPDLTRVFEVVAEHVAACHEAVKK